MTTIKDIATAAGVSKSTVSIVLNNQAKTRKITPETAERVLKAAQELRYQPNLSARRLRSLSEQPFTIAFFWASDARLMSMTRVFKGLSRVVLENQRVALMYQPYTEGQLHQCAALYDQRSFDAAIIATASREDLNYLEKEPPSIPIVLFNRDSEHFSNVCVDNDEIGRIAADLLFERGARNIGVIGHHTPYLAMGRRRAGFLRACEAKGMIIPQESQIFADDTMEGGFLAGMRIARLKDRFDGIFCDDDLIAMGLLSAFNQCGIQVPQQTRVITVGMLPPEFAMYTVPSLTVVQLPLEEMADRCIALLVDRLTTRSSASVEKVLLSARTYTRESC